MQQMHISWNIRQTHVTIALCTAEWIKAMTLNEYIYIYIFSKGMINLFVNYFFICFSITIYSGSMNAK